MYQKKYNIKAIIKVWDSNNNLYNWNNTHLMLGDTVSEHLSIVWLGKVKRKNR